MKKTLLFLAIPLWGLTTLAQDSTFHLKDYKYRTPGYRALTISIGMSGGVSSSKYEPTYDRLEKYISLAPTSVSYYKIKSTEQKFQTSTLNFIAAGANTSQTLDGNKRSNSQVQSFLSWQQDRRYYKANQWYWQLGNELSGGLRSLDQKDTADHGKNNESSFEYAASVGFGKGRIEAVQDAQMALCILNDLEAQGLINAPVTRDQAEGFAKLITSINNRRVFDFRRRRIYELTQIDSFLRASGLAETTNISHFAVINDNWSLAFNPARLSGTSWYIKLKPTVAYNRKRNDFTGNTDNYYTHTDYWRLGVTPVIGVERYLPVSLKFQKSMGATLSWLPARNRESRKSFYNSTPYEDIINYSESAERFTGFYGLGYFPNNRTLLNATLSVVAIHADSNVSSINRNWQVTPQLNFDADYFVGYRTRLQARINVVYNYSEALFANNISRTDKSFYSNFSIDLVHAFF